MTTMIAVYSDRGAARCDARCYEAAEPECDCVCGGRNHGIGMSRAIENTRELAEEWMEAYAASHELRDPRWEIPARDPVQLDLFAEAVV